MLLIPGTLAAQDARRAESPRPSTSAAQARRDSVVSLARQQLGRRYRFGGTGSSGFDCSGFTRYLMRAMGQELPRTAAQQAQVGRPVPRDVSQLRAGDLLTFGRGGRVSHIGMYIGNGRYIHASSRAGRIVEADLERRHLVRVWNGVRRFLADADSAPTAVAARTPSTTVPVPAQR